MRSSLFQGASRWTCGRSLTIALSSDIAKRRTDYTQKAGMPSLLQAWAPPIAFVAIASVSATWYKLVSEHVPQPYLDEFFHVPQAQRYCRNDYTWDPKITTPPGLYLASLLFVPLAGCDTSALRALNVGAICLICVLAYHICRVLREPLSDPPTTTKSSATLRMDKENKTSVLDAHSALNISLFPPLFFFSGLYYTDVLSTLAVLAAHYAYLKQRNTGSYFMGCFTTVSLRVVALLFRQTNIFWVAVFPAGLSVVDALKRHAEPEGRPSRGLFYDVSVEEAGPGAYFGFIFYLAVDIIRKPVPILKAVFPHVVLLALFAVFVIWNGGVVLGDKSAHVATIHLPQMLYIWPYLIFFSFPLALPSLLHLFLSLLPTHLQSFCQRNLTGTPNRTRPSLLAAVLFIIPALPAVHYNTIIHPYTLADNRHYVFYVFRILLRHPSGKYIAVPIYYLCACLAIRCLTAPTRDVRPTTSDPGRQLHSLGPAHKFTRVSFVVVWVAATALSVVTAPLVEPRYFIIPWIIWRLHVPYIATAASGSGEIKRGSYDLRLIFETVWLLVVNAVVGYMFLHRRFEWANEPGKVQRFIW